MSEEKRQYQGRRHTSRREPQKKHIYLKKLARQTLISAAIFGVFVATGNSNSVFLTRMQKLAKSAITYQLNSAHIFGFFNKIFELTQKPQLKSTEENINENNENIQNTV